MRGMQLGRSVTITAPRAAPGRRGGACIPRAATRTAASDGWSTESAYERVLRYPDGKVRDKRERKKRTRPCPRRGISPPKSAAAGAAPLVAQRRLRPPRRAAWVEAWAHDACVG